MFIIAQLKEHLAGVMKDPGLNHGENFFFHLNFFLSGNEPNGKEQEQQLK